MAPNDFGSNPSAPSSPSDGMTRKSLLLSEEAALAQDSAMDLLSRSMASQREISPSQGIAAALLAAIPTLGGYLIGKSVGTSKVPEGVLFDPSKLDPTGGYVGGLAGSQIGANASKDYTGAIETDNLHKQKVLAAEAQIENDRAQQLRQQANTVENAALAIDADIAKMPLELQQYAAQQKIAEQSQIRAHIAKSQYDNAHEKQFTPAEIEIAKKVYGVDLSGSSPQGINVINNIGAEQRRIEGQNFRQRQSAIPGFVNLSGAELNPSTAAKLSEQNFGIQKTKQLLDQYLAAPDAYTGDASAIQGAIAGMLVNAQRMATGSGANFTGMEQSLIKVALPIALAGGDLLSWVKAQALGRDQKIFAQSLKDIYQKTQDYAIAEAYGHVRENAPPGYYPPQILQQWGVEDSRVNQLKQRKAELEAKIAAGGQ